MLINKTKRKKIEKIIQKYYNAIQFRFAGGETLTAGEIKELSDAGLIDPQEALKSYVEEAYTIARVRNPINGRYTKTDLNKFRVFDSFKYKPITDKEKFALEHIRDSAGLYITNLKETFVNKVSATILNSNQELAQEAFLTPLRSVIEDNIKKKEGVNKLVSALRDLTGDYNRNWTRVSETELSSAFNKGNADAISARNKGKSDEEVVVYKIVSNDAKICRSCLSLYLMPTGEPRLYTMRELIDNGTNYGKKASEYQATIGPLHPNCRCTLQEMTAGFDFKEGTQFTTFKGLDKTPLDRLKEQRDEEEEPEVKSKKKKKK